MEYNPRNFKNVFESEIGKNIWSYLNSDNGKERMILTTQLGHPAAEGIGDKLLEKCGEGVKVDNVKQATGHMIRHVMEEMGYKHNQRSVQCRKKTEVFSKASRYIKG
jgi:hypothetical protein